MIIKHGVLLEYINYLFHSEYKYAFTNSRLEFGDVVLDGIEAKRTL